MDRSIHELDVVTELPEPTIAIEAEYPSNPFRLVIVIDVLGLPSAAQGTDPSLLQDYPGNLCSVDPAAPGQVERPRASVVLQTIAANDLVVAPLAVPTVTRPG